MLCGTGVGSASIPPLTNALIDAYGWRGGYVGLGLAAALVVTPILWLFFFDVRKLRGPGVEAAPTVPAPLTGWTLAQGLRRRQFYQLILCALVVTALIVGMQVHLVPMISATGISREVVSSLVSVIGIVSVVGRLLVGLLFDRLPGPPIGAISVALPAVTAVLLLMFPDVFWVVLVAILLFGLSVGGEYDAIIYLSTRYFGMGNFGSLFGFVSSALLAGIGLGPVFAGFIYDGTGSYALFLELMIPAALFCGLMLGTLGRYPDHMSHA